MATMMAPVGEREVLRCDHCELVQFRANNSMCRRCHKPLEIQLPEPEPVAELPLVEATAEPGGLQVAQAVKELRLLRNLSQRQLALRMHVPRTYISKIENAKATPTLSSLERLAAALQVELPALLRDSRARRQDEIAVVLSDPFIREIAALLPGLDSIQRSIFLNQVRELASGVRERRKTA
jgi:transcriptional regulator with XRE-family HTH domain